MFKFKFCKLFLNTFTFFEEDLSFCGAKLKYIALSQILAPVTNRMDADKIFELFNNNLDKENYCVHNTYNLASYWASLDVAYDGSKQEKKFTNGIDWDEKIHPIIQKTLQQNKML